MTSPLERLAAGLIVALHLTACGLPGNEANPRTGGPAASQRIVTLSPHLAELVFAVGSGHQLVGVSAYTDYPAAVTDLPVIGDAFNIDQERLTLLEPDLLLAWDTGTPAHVIDELRNRGYTVEVITTTSLSDIGAALKRIGALTGRESDATAAADSFSAGLDDIARQSTGAASIDVFYQVYRRPLYTINGTHFVSQLIELCGGRNVFDDLDGLAPLISVEAMLERNPEVILASTDAGQLAFEEWERWPDLPANRFGNRYLIPANDIGRPTPRLLAGARAVCEALQKSRDNREAKTHDRAA